MAFELLLNKNLAKELDSFLKLIDEAFTHLKNEGYTIKEAKMKQWEDYGFYIYNKDKTINIFVGLWFTMWAEKNALLCLCLDWKENAKNQIHLIDTFKKQAEKHPDIFDPYFEFHEYPTLAFHEKYISNMSDPKNIINRLFNVMNELGTEWK